MEATCFRKMVRNKNAELTINTIFYILMAIVFVTIVVYGINKMFFIESQMSDIELIKVEDKLEKAISYCDDPLNSGNKKVFSFDHKAFNSICILGDEYEEPSASIHSSFSVSETSLEEVYNAGDNVVLLSTAFTRDGENYIMEDYQIISSLNIDTIGYDAFCKFDYNNSGELEFAVICR